MFQVLITAIRQWIFITETDDNEKFLIPLYNPEPVS